MTAPKAPETIEERITEALYWWTAGFRSGMVTALQRFDVPTQVAIEAATAAAVYAHQDPAWREHMRAGIEQYLTTGRAVPGHQFKVHGL